MSVWSSSSWYVDVGVHVVPRLDGDACSRRSQVVELNAFFLKDLLWVPPESPLNVQRLLVWALIGAVAIRDYYHFMENPTVKR